MGCPVAQLAEVEVLAAAMGCTTGRGRLSRTGGAARNRCRACALNTDLADAQAHSQDHARFPRAATHTRECVCVSSCAHGNRLWPTRCAKPLRQLAGTAARYYAASKMASCPRPATL